MRKVDVPNMAKSFYNGDLAGKICETRVCGLAPGAPGVFPRKPEQNRLAGSF